MLLLYGKIHVDNTNFNLGYGADSNWIDSLNIGLISDQSHILKVLPYMQTVCTKCCYKNLSGKLNFEVSERLESNEI